MTVEQRSRIPILTVLRDIPFMALWSGRAISQLGDWIANLAIIDLVYRLTGSGGAVGVLLMVQLLPGLVLAPVAGIYVDRWDRKRVLIACELYWWDYWRWLGRGGWPF